MIAANRRRDRRALIGSLTLGAVGVAMRPAAAQSWPSRPVRLVIPYAVGGPTDILGRAIGPALAEALGQAVVIENRAGAGAIVGMAAVAKAPPDGYTLLLGDINLSVNPSLYRTLPYDGRTELVPVSLVAAAPLVLVVAAGSPYRSLRDLIDAARSRPGKLSFGSAGAGNTTHLASELLKGREKLDAAHVPYKGAGPAINDVAAGQIDWVISGLSGVQSLLQAGKLRALAITGDRRAAALPDVPTFAEAGTPLPEMKLGSWWGVLVPAGTPADVVASLNRSIERAMSGADLKSRLAAQNIETMTSTPAAFGDWIRDEAERWDRVLKAARVQPE